MNGPQPVDDTADVARPFDACWQLYQHRKAAFLAANHSASPDEIEAFCQQLAEEVGL